MKENVCIYTHPHTWDGILWLLVTKKNNLKLLRLKKVTMVKRFMKWDWTNFFSMTENLHFDFYCAPYIKKLIMCVYIYNYTHSLTKYISKLYMCAFIHTHIHTRVQLFSLVWLFVTLWAIALQAPLSMGFFRQEHWSGLPFPSPGDLPDPETEPVSPTWLKPHKV